jgi:hypothetical protein
MRGNLKWHLYDPKPETSTMDEALEEIMNAYPDCFFIKDEVVLAPGNQTGYFRS